MTGDEIESELEIRGVLARYCHGVDHGDLGMAVGVFWPDAVDSHGDHWEGNAQDYMGDLIERFAAACPPGSGRRACVHQLSSILIARTGPDEARVEASFTAYVPHVDDGVSRLALLVGRFLDHFERRETEWRIRGRTVVNDFSRFDIGSGIFGPGSWQEGGYVAGGFGKDDPGVRFLSELD